MSRIILTELQKNTVYKKCAGHCAYCGKEITFKQMQCDHYYPYCLKDYLYQNGNILVEDMLNILPSCRSCNHYKRADLPEHFREKMRTIHSRLLNIYIAKVAKDYGIITIQPFDGLFYFERNPVFSIIYPSSLD